MPRKTSSSNEDYEVQETKSERLSKKSYGQGTDNRSPTYSKNIKIIDQFELKDSSQKGKKRTQRYEEDEEPQKEEEVEFAQEDRRNLYELDTQEINQSLGTTFKDSKVLR